MRSYRIAAAIVFLILSAFIAQPSIDAQAWPDPPEQITPSSKVSATPPPVPQTLYYSVISVADGDTFTIQYGAKKETLRLIGIDTPEIHDPRKSVQCFGEEASARAKETLTGASVRIETDPTQDTYDKYGRLLVYAYLPNGTFFNELMIAEGYAYEYTYHLPYRYQTEFKAAEQTARANKRGLWSPNACNGTRSPTTAIQLPTSDTDEIVCSSNTYNCSGFTSQKEAQRVFDACGGSSNDIHKLDSDGDDVVCESLP